MIAGFLDVLLRAVALVALCAAAGGVAHILWTLRPVAHRSPLGGVALRRSLGLIAIGAVTVAVSRVLLIAVVHPWALADEAGRWPVAAFLATDFGRAGLVSIALAVGLAVCVAHLRGRPDAGPAAWAVLAALAVALCVGGAWLAHAASRLEGRGSLMLATLLHQLGAILWVGGLVHLVGFLGLWRRAGADDALGATVLTRFAAIALPGLGFVLVPGLALSWGYVGDGAGLVGTGYGIMVLTKVILLAGALVLGGMNFMLARRPRRSGVIGPLLEAEVGVGITILLAAASLTSLPPAVDVVEDRARVAEVAARFVPAPPRLASPPVGRLLAVAGPIDDTLATRQPEEFAWSEYNHHMAGFFVLAMGIMSLLERTGVRWARHWPLGFLGLAAFLFVRNDPRAWPLGPAGFWESMLLPDVLQHRLVVLVVVALAVFEWLVRAGRLRAAGWRLVFPLLCATGGALLLTHSHAMFNLKSEFLAEVSHAPMGILAVFMGWGRWLELRLPAAEASAGGGALARLPGWVSSVAFVLIGGILLVYRES